MKQIEFRGKRIDNGEWVYGYYVDDKILGHRILDSQNNYNPIDPETVGQFTGLLDKNGKKIFTGDVIEEGVVYFDDEYLGFFVKGDFVEGDHEPLYAIPLPEIIDNVHENPELLK